MRIYKLTSLQTDQVYVGKTSQTLRDRFNEHRSDYKNWLQGIHSFYSSFFLMDYDDVKMELIEETNNSLREIYWIRKLNSVNFEHNGDDYYIHKQKTKHCRLGFLYRFGIKRNKKHIVNKFSTDLEYLRKFRDEWIKNNQHIFIDE